MAPNKRMVPAEKKKLTFHPKWWLVAFGLSWSLAMAGPLAQTTPTSSNPKKDPLVLKGKQLYADLRCFYCHKLKGRGGTVGPALDNVGFRRTQEWMAHHFRDPKEVSQGTKMIKLKLKDSQFQALVAYMNSLGGYTFTPQAPDLYKANCAACHSLNGEITNATDLFKEGKFRDMDFLMDYIRDPAKVNSEAKMIKFVGVLTEAQIKDIAAYLYQQSRQ